MFDASGVPLIVLDITCLILGMQTSFKLLFFLCFFLFLVNFVLFCCGLICQEHLPNFLWCVGAFKEQKPKCKR